MLMHKKIKHTQSILILILSISVLAQLIFLTHTYLTPWTKAIITHLDKSAIQRSGIYSPWLDDHDYSFLGFIRNVTEAEASIIFYESSGPLSWQPMLQYFLFPRQVVVCTEGPIQSCALKVSGDLVYIALSEGSRFTKEEFGSARYIPFGNSADLGLMRIRQR